MTRTIWDAAGGASSQMQRRLAVTAFVGCGQFMPGALTFFQRDIGMRESDANQEGHHTGDGLELPDLDVVVGRPCAGRDQQLLNAVVRDGTHDPDPIVTGAFLVCRFLAQDFSAITTFHEFAESRLRNHIWCFYFPVHDCDHTSLFSRRRIAMPTMDITNIRKYINETQDILLRF
jgi:hypothetical protein